MSDQILDPAALLALDVSTPESRLVFRRGLAILAGWTEVELYRSGELVGNNPFADNQLLPVDHYESSLDAMITLPLDDPYFFDFHGPCIDSKGKITWIAWIRRRWTEYYKPEYGEYAATPALAGCRAWLKYKIESH